MNAYVEISNMVSDGLQVRTWRHAPFVMSDPATVWIVPGTIKQAAE